MTQSWFPLPAQVADIEVVPPIGRWGADNIMELLSDPGAVEWRDKVGVVGREDGSGKPSTRLIASQGAVAKTRLDQARDDRESLLSQLLRARAPGLSASVWHPSKQWFLLRSAGKWYPLTVCQELRTLRRLSDLKEKFSAWTQMLLLSVKVSTVHQLGLDVNPANFAIDPEDRCLYYLDEELYPPLSEREIAGAIVARIPEEPQAEPRDWGVFAADVYKALTSLATAAVGWEQLCHEVARYPLAERYSEHRAAVLSQLSRLAPRASTRYHGRSEGHRRTCVFADVHGNLPALEAVLGAARSAEVDSYLFLGDVVGYGPHPRQCIQRLAELENAILLRGNHDHAIATRRLDLGMNRLARRCAEWTIGILSEEERRWLGQLPVEVRTGGWMAVHGAPKDPHRFLAYVYELTYEDNLRHIRNEAIPLCFYGHTHVQLVHAELAAGPTKLLGQQCVELASSDGLLINPGSVGQPRDGDPRAAFAIWDRERDRVTFHRAEYDVAAVIADLHELDLPDQLEERLRSGT